MEVIVVFFKLLKYFVFSVFLVPNPENPEEIMWCGRLKCHFGEWSISKISPF